MNSTLFFNNITCIDHAFVDNIGNIVGGSYHPIITVKGKVTEDESVVVDFSSGKKQMKSIIDHDNGEIGLDHKLWIIPGYSACMTKNYSDTHYEIETRNGSRVVLPKTDVHIVSGNFTGSVMQTVATDISSILSQQMTEYEFDVELTQIPFSVTQNPMMFRYSHGLKNSTSYGCKNIAHGHLSFFEITKFGNDYREDCDDCKTGLRLIEETLKGINGSMFIMRENIISEDEQWIEFGYETPRGKMWAKINRNQQANIIVDSETTIEYLAEFIAKRMMNALLLAKVKEFRVSEGLQKGVVYRLDSDPGNVIF